MRHCHLQEPKGKAYKPYQNSPSRFLNEIKQNVPQGYLALAKETLQESVVKSAELNYEELTTEEKRNMRNNYIMMNMRQYVGLASAEDVVKSI